MSNAKQAEEMHDRRQQKQHERQKEQRALQAAFNDNGKLDKGWMEKILDVQDIEEQLDAHTVNKIQSLLNKQWFIANLTNAETHDKVYWLEVQRYKLTAYHPPEDSKMTGAVRAFVMDDEEERLKPLTPQERNDIDQIIKTIQNMVTRSRDGFERKQINTSINRAETENGEEDSDSTFTGLFS